jgi:hypothetical protein
LYDVATEHPLDLNKLGISSALDDGCPMRPSSSSARPPLHVLPEPREVFMVQLEEAVAEWAQASRGKSDAHFAAVKWLRPNSPIPVVVTCQS